MLSRCVLWPHQNASLTVPGPAQQLRMLARRLPGLPCWKHAAVPPCSLQGRPPCIAKWHGPDCSTQGCNQACSAQRAGALRLPVTHPRSARPDALPEPWPSPLPPPPPHPHPRHACPAATGARIPESLKVCSVAAHGFMALDTQQQQHQHQREHLIRQQRFRLCWPFPSCLCPAWHRPALLVFYTCTTAPFPACCVCLACSTCRLSWRGCFTGPWIAVLSHRSHICLCGVIPLI